MSDTPIFDSLDSSFGYEEFIAEMRRIEKTTTQSMKPTYRLAIGVPFSTEQDDEEIYFSPSYWLEGPQEPRTGTGQPLSGFDSTWLSEDSLNEAEDDENFFYLEADSSSFEKSVKTPIVKKVPRTVSEVHTVGEDLLMDGIDMVHFCARRVEEFKDKHPGIGNVTVQTQHVLDGGYRIILTSEYLDEPLPAENLLARVLTPLQMLSVGNNLENLQDSLRGFQVALRGIAGTGDIKFDEVFTEPSPKVDLSALMETSGINYDTIEVTEEHTEVSYQEIVEEIRAQILVKHPNAMITGVANVKKEDDGSITVSVEATRPSGDIIEDPLSEGDSSEE